MSCGGGAICAAAVRRAQAPVFARIGPAAAGKADTPSLRAIAAPAVPDAGGRARIRNLGRSHADGGGRRRNGPSGKSCR